MRMRMEPRIDSFLTQFFLQYARDLREEHPSRDIRNKSVLESALREFSGRGLITLVTAEDIPTWLPPGKMKLVRAKNGQPIWMPTKKLIENWIEIARALRPALDGDSLCWSVRNTDEFRR